MKSDPPARLGRHRQVAAVLAGDPPADGQPQAGPALLGRVVGVEQPRRGLGRNAPGGVDPRPPGPGRRRRPWPTGSAPPPPLGPIACTAFSARFSTACWTSLGSTSATTGPAAGTTRTRTRFSCAWGAKKSASSSNIACKSVGRGSSSICPAYFRKSSSVLPQPPGLPLHDPQPVQHPLLVRVPAVQVLAQQLQVQLHGRQRVLDLVRQPAGQRAQLRQPFRPAGPPLQQHEPPVGVRPHGRPGGPAGRQADQQARHERHCRHGRRRYGQRDGDQERRAMSAERRTGGDRPRSSLCTLRSSLCASPHASPHASPRCPASRRTRLASRPFSPWSCS